MNRIAHFAGSGSPPPDSCLLAPVSCFLPPASRLLHSLFVPFVVQLLFLLPSLLLAQADVPLPDDTAAIVIGQPDFNHPFANRTDARGLIAPGAVAVDSSVTPYRLYVADPGNHRVLAYKTPLPATRPAPADLVIGQPDFYGAFFDDARAGRDRLLTPVGLAVDAQGNLYVCDRDYNRVVEFDRPFETDTLADAVIGQSGSFETLDPNRGGVSAGSLNHPGGIGIDPGTGTLWVADTGNHRVLGYKSPRTTDAVANVVIGQRDFKTNTQNTGGRSPRSLYGPLGVSALDGTLAVADTGNHRVLIYRNPVGTHAVADAVLGQDGSFQTAEQGCSPFRLRLPAAVTLVTLEPAASGTSPSLSTARAAPPSVTSCTLLHLLVSDTGNNRVLLFDLGPGSTGQPTALWGQGHNLHSNLPNPGGTGPDTLEHPLCTALTPGKTVWIADTGNHRILCCDKDLGNNRPISGDRSADRVLGQIDFAHATPNFMDGRGLAYPRDVAIDRSVEPNRLYICDFDNNRVLGYGRVNDLGPDRRPDVVIGQPDEFTNAPGTNPQALSLPSALAVDGSGGLFVADRENNRVLWFADPFGTDQRADRVFGQPDFNSCSSNNGGISARSLNRPEGVAVDARGNLYVADTRNHRILRYDTPLASDTVADAVWGQGGDFTKGAELGGVGVRADTSSYPFGLDIRPDGLMAVADTNNHRVLLFDVRADKPSPAIRVFGQDGDFASHQDNRGGCSEASLSGPEGVAFWQKGLFVADTANCQIVYYGDATGGGLRAYQVFGQEGSFTTKGPRPARTSARTLWFPSGIDLDMRGNLYVADREHSRVLVFESAGGSPRSSGQVPIGGKKACSGVSGTTIPSE